MNRFLPIMGAVGRHLGQKESSSTPRQVFKNYLVLQAPASNAIPVSSTFLLLGGFAERTTLSLRPRLLSISNAGAYCLQSQSQLEHASHLTACTFFVCLQKKRSCSLAEQWVCSTKLAEKERTGSCAIRSLAAISTGEVAACPGEVAACPGDGSRLGCILDEDARVDAPPCVSKTVSRPLDRESSSQQFGE